MQAFQTRPRLGVLAILALVALASSPSREPKTAGLGFDARWHDGRAELDGYRYTITRYGEERRGQAVMIFVTEPWSRSKRVKVEDASKHPDDVLDVLKLNIVRDFQTGIYDYNTMVSLFVGSRDFSPVEITFTSAEWCGNVYAKVLFDKDAINETRFSYFEDESGTKLLERPRDGVAQDALFIWLRGLRGEFLPAGGRRTTPLLSGILESRLRHHPLEWSAATIDRAPQPVSVRVPAGNWENAIYYEVKAEDGRMGRFWIEPDGDRRILKWSWSESGRGEASESGELAGTRRTTYWKENGSGDEQLLRQLGLGPAVR